MHPFLDSVQSSQLSGLGTEQAKQSISPDESHQQFADVLKTAIDKVNKAEVHADAKTKAMAQGDTDNLHDVMIAAQKEQIMLEGSVQMQRKVIDAYNDVMRMQI